jgi:hypothetical protein
MSEASSTVNKGWFYHPEYPDKGPESPALPEQNYSEG